MVNIPPTTVISPSLRREHVHDGKIVIYTLTDVRRETVDMWVAAMTQRIQNAGADKVFFTLYDATYWTLAFTPYMRKKFQEFSMRHNDVTGCTAILVKDTPVVRILQLFIQREISRRYKKQQIRIFFKREQAMNWLIENIDKQAP